MPVYIGKKSIFGQVLPKPDRQTTESPIKHESGVVLIKIHVNIPKGGTR